ncbi:uncharacterized protein BYT42DRAFT_618085 [Radiomyces spectabilis]|uniref:uncharacterized protein n=1 Tax=Radiomyces spectabilis TaxID=64574 RepID=UPI0022212559|nr:uncharacterized protein BYT42DRAFT_618085 [Radiomyces spectabilis]KAI8367667.1 hypothetical protein BYT42DRAFT_618085 [Radiomyces spectabilis]
MEAISRFAYDDVSTLTTFDLCDDTETETDQEGVLSKFLSKFRTAVSSPSPYTPAHASARSSLQSVPRPDDDSGTKETDTYLKENENSALNIPTATQTAHLKPLSTTSEEIERQELHVIPPTPPDAVSLHHHHGRSPPTAIMPRLSDLATTSNHILSPMLPPRLSTDSGLLGEPMTKTSSCDSDTQSVMTTFSVSNSNSLSRILNRLRGDKSNREYWMPDEHCQIFCSKCASQIIRGERISQTGIQLRVCNYCFSKLEAQEQESSLQEAYIYSASKPADTEAMLQLPPVLLDQKPLSVVPQMQIPTTTVKGRQNELYGGEHSTTFSLEIPTGTLLPYTKPSSSSALSTSMPATHMPGSPILPTQESDTGLKKLLLATNTLLKKPRSRTSTANNLGIDTSFLQPDTKQLGSPLPFRRNSITMHSPCLDSAGGTILPSNEYTLSLSDDEDDDHAGWDNNAQNLLNFLGGHSERPNSGIFSGFLTDDLLANGISLKAESGTSDEDGHPSPKIRLTRTDELRARERSNSLRRRFSVVNGPNRPIRLRTQSLMRNAPITTSWLDSTKDLGLSSLTDNGTSMLVSPVADGSHPLRDSLEFPNRTRPLSSLKSRHRRASSVPLTIELNASALEHMRKMLRHMLSETNDDIREHCDEWEQVLMNLLLKVSDNVHPDIRDGDEIDIRHYIKIKKIAGGLPSDSFYVKGVVCSKNVAHKKMVKTINNPQILILLFPLEWSRGSSRGEHQFQSIKPVLAQEKEYLEKLINRIVALKPNIVLSSSNVSRLALDFLLKANIVVVYNVKLSVLDAVARCTGASIVSSFLQLSKEGLNLGHCELFETQTIVHEWIENRRKTFLKFDQCPPDLGATIILRGGRVETLCAVKRILDFMVFVVHNLKLESFLLRDFSKMRNAFIKPNLVAEPGDIKPEERDGAIQANTANKEVKAETTDKEQAHSRVQQQEKKAGNTTHDSPRPDDKIDDDDPWLTPINNSIQQHVTATLSASPIVQFPEPYLLLRLKETQRKLIKIIRCKKLSELPADAPVTLSSTPNFFRAFEQVICADPEFDQLLEEHHQRWRALEAYIGDAPDNLSPSYHQQFVVLYTSVCKVTTVPCQGPEMRMFEYYRPDSDLTLGQYIEDIAADAQLLCPSSMCERTMLQHYRSYAHGNARINVEIEQFECAQPILTNSILTWSYCKYCSMHTSLVPMSENSWKYSFGKFLELMFYHVSDTTWKTEGCSHNMFKDYVHYFGVNGYTARFQYEAIEPYEVHVPPMHLYVNSDSQRAAKDSLLESTRTKITKYYESLVERNKLFSLDIVQPSMVESCKEQLQEMSRRVTGEKKQMLQFLQSVYATTSSTDTLSLNQVRIKLQMNVMQWDIEYAEFVKQYVRPERELRRLTASHLKKMLPADSIMLSTPVSSLDLRTKRATEAVDLPLLDVGLDDGPTDLYGVSGTVTDASVGAPLSPLKQLPLLGESPTTASPWLEEEERLNSLLQEMHDQQLNAAKKRGMGPIQETIEKIEEDAASQLLDPSVARRLSLELMKDNLKQNSGSWKSATDTEGTSTDLTRPGNKKDFGSTGPRMPLLDHRAAVLPLLSSNACKRLTELLNDTQISKSKSSPSPSGSLLASRIPEPSRTSNRKRPTAMNEVKPAPVPVKKTANSLNPLRGMALPEWTPRKELPLSGYRYGFRGSSERGNLSHPRSRPRPTNTGNKLQTKAEAIGEPEAAKSTKTGPAASSGSSKIRFSKAFLNHAKARGIRQRLPSKSSIEVYTTINELVRDESDDEFPVLELDDATDVELDDEDGANQHQSLNRTFSLTRTDEYDESLGREDMPPPYSRDPLGILGTTLPHLSFDPEDSQAARTKMVDTDNSNMVSPSASLLDVPKQTTLDNAGLELTSSGPERNSFIRAITSMLAEKGLGNLLPLEYPLSPLEHVFPGSLIVVGEDEPSTIVAYTLSCDDYLEKLQEIREGYAEEVSLSEDGEKSATGAASMTDAGEASSTTSGMASGVFIERTLRSKSGIHVKYYFTDGTTKFFCKIFFAEQFDALRRNCGCDESFVSSLASCCKWDSSGGKSGSVFLKTKDDRFLIKQISKYEMDAFLRFAPSYFQYMSEAFFHELPTVLSKIFGLYRIGFKNTTTGRSMRMDILVMENLFYQRVVKKIFDLKGSMRNRHVQVTGKENEVLLDENMVELMFQSPLFLRSHSKEMLRGSLHNDTLFLSRLDVMDYSLLVGVDEERQELVVGIVDFIRTFTWDKKLESWVKESGILGGGGKEPTIISPRQYRLRFREAMDRYFFTVPDFWATKHMRNHYDVNHHAHHHHSTMENAA